MEGIILAREPMWRHTTFQVGGAADLYAVPADEEDLRRLLHRTGEEGIETFTLGGGSNLLVADSGIRGLVIDMRAFNEYRLDDNQLVLGAGLIVSDAAWKAGSQGLEGLDFLFAMPGTVGGAVWMNARCYDREIADRFAWADLMDSDGRITRVDMDRKDWDYKVSPFQENQRMILRAGFNMTDGDPVSLRRSMLEKRDDRESKGHFRSPCAGSAFKNNRNFGEPSGTIIDRCGLKGLRIGGAAVSPWHGNIVINDRGASAQDIRELMNRMAETVEAKTGFRMESEIRVVGDWPVPDGN